MVNFFMAWSVYRSKMELATTVLLLAITLTNGDFIRASLDHSDIIENLMSFKGNELAFLTDSKQVVFKPQRIQTPLKMFNVDDVLETLQNDGETKCPAWNDLNHVHKPFYTRNSDYRHYTFVLYIQPDHLGKAMAILDNTVLNCSHVIEPGAYNMDNRFLFLLDKHENGEQFSENLFKSSPHIARHRHVNFWVLDGVGQSQKNKP